MNKISLAARSVSMAAAMGLAVTFGVPAVIAQPANPTAGNINFKETGSITLYKKLGEETSDRATGHEMQGVPGEKLPGVEFTITKLDYDLENDDWSTFPKMASEVKEGDKTTVVRTGTTNVADGMVNFPNLELGLYLVEETKTPDGIVGGAPFIVSIPMVDHGSEAWNYNVVAYPKNSKNEAVLNVYDGGQNFEDEFIYEIMTLAPTFDENRPLRDFRFEDVLDRRLDFVGVTEIQVPNGPLDESDYSVDFNETNGELVVALNDSGLAKLESGEHLSMQFRVKRNAVGDSMAVKNQASVVFTNPNSNNPVTTTTNEVATYHANLKVVKQDGEQENTVLEGAKFELTQCGSANKIKIDGVSEWETNEDGILTIEGLHVTDFADNNEIEPQKYCLVETEAPAGYQKDPNPVEVDFKRSDINPDYADNDNIVTLEKSITNLKSGTPNLPMTGGMGIGTLVAIGAALAAVGAWFARRGAKN